MSHPQLVAKLLGRPLPPLASELRAANVPAVAPAVQASTSEQPAQACRVVRIGRFSADCAVHGRFTIDEYAVAPRCEGSR